MQSISRLLLLGLFTISFHSLYAASAVLPPDLKFTSDKTTGEGGYPIEVESNVLSGYIFRLVDTQSFQMGSTDGDKDEQPTHSVKLGTPVYVGVCPVSNKDYKVINTSFVPNSENKYSKDDDQPVTYLDFSEANAFANDVNTAAIALGKPAGSSYFLPTEAIWEKAASEGGSGKYPWGSDLADADKKFYSKSSAKDANKSIRSTTKFFNMTGNIYCWCSDWYDKEYYKNSPSTDPTGASSGKTKSLRGGKWYIYEKSLRTSDRWDTFPDTHSQYIGVRLCRDLQGIVPATP